MSLVCVSWTSTVMAVLNGRPKVRELRQARFAFSCQREHVLRSDGLLPCEVTWGNVSQKGDRTYGDSVKIDKVDSKNRARVQSLIDLIAAADAEGRVEWGIYHPQDYIARLPGDTVVLYQQYRKPAADYGYKPVLEAG